MIVFQQSITERVKALYMRRILVDRIRGKEILSRDIYDNMGTILMAAGTTVKQEYRQRLQALGIRYIYVEDELAQGIYEEEAMENKIKDQCQQIMQEVLERYLTSGSNELDRLKNVSKEVILNVMEKPEVMYSIAGVRRKSEGMYSHSLSVCAMSVLISLRHGLSRKKVEEIAMGSLLHDVGFSVLSIHDGEYSYEALTEKEKREVKMHVITGFEIVEKEKWLSKEAKEIILSHHERLDGSGYPRRLLGTKLGIGTRIVAVCDAFDRMVYGYFTKQYKVPQAFERIIMQGGQTMDAEVVKTFYESVAAYPTGSVVVTNRGEKAIVLRQNYKLPMHPVIRLLENAQGSKYADWVEKDLSKEVSILIEDIVE